MQSLGLFPFSLRSALLTATNLNCQFAQLARWFSARALSRYTESTTRKTEATMKTIDEKRKYKREYMRRYYREHKDEMRQNCATWRERHREAYREYQREYTRRRRATRNANV